MQQTNEMERYIGISLTNAAPMTLLEYNKFRGWELPDDENGADDGFIIEIPGALRNTTKFEGYITWLPKDQFEQLNKQSGKLSFSAALIALFAGQKVARSGWNGKGMYLVYFSPLEHGFADGFEIRGEMKPLRPFIVMKTADDMYIPWLASQADMLSNDWEIL